jgi:hypothetical protein
MTFPTWARLLIENRGLVHPIHWPRAAVLTVASLLNTVLAFLDTVLFGWLVRRARVRAPLFILGHFRSGTTHLHNLLALDPSFAFPTLYESMNPDTFLTGEAFLRMPTQLLLLRKRPQDDVAIGPDTPAEDELAVGLSTLRSPYMGLVFPRDRARYDACLILEGHTQREVARWIAGLRRFLQKVTWK